MFESLPEIVDAKRAPNASDLIRSILASPVMGASSHGNIAVKGGT